MPKKRRSRGAIIFSILPTVKRIDFLSWNTYKRMVMKQLGLFKEQKREVEFGGSLLEGKRKGPRPFSRKKAMHVTFRRSDFYSTLSFFGKKSKIHSLVNSLANKHGIRIYDFSINSNHIHLLLKSPAKLLFQRFLSECSINIVWLMTGTRKGKRLLAPFWESRPWSRIVEWGRAFFALKAYVFRNRLEASGIIPYDRNINTSQALELAYRPPY